MKFISWSTWIILIFLCFCELCMPADEIQFYYTMCNLTFMLYYCHFLSERGVAVYLRRLCECKLIDFGRFCEFPSALIEDLTLLVVAMYYSQCGNVMQFVSVLDGCLTYFSSFRILGVIGTDHTWLVEWWQSSLNFFNFLRSSNFFCWIIKPTRKGFSLIFL